MTEKARAFAWICLGVLALVAAYQLGVRSAGAQSAAPMVEGERNIFHETITTQFLNVIDDDVNPVATITSVEGHPMIVLYGPGRGMKRAVVIGTDEGGGGLVQTYNPANQVMVELGEAEGGVAGSVTTRGAEGGKLVSLGANFLGGMVTTWDGNGKKLLGLGIRQFGDAAFVAYDGEGEPRVSWPPRED